MLNIPNFHWRQCYSKGTQVLQPSSPWQTINSTSDATYPKALPPERSLMLIHRASNACAPPNVCFGCVDHHLGRWWSPFAGNGSGGQIAQLIIQGTSDTKLARFRIKPQSWWSFWSEMYIHHTPSNVQNLCHRLGSSQRKWHLSKNLSLSRQEGRMHKQKLYDDCLRLIMEKEVFSPLKSICRIRRIPLHSPNTVLLKYH